MISQNTFDFVDEFLKSPLDNLINGNFKAANSGKVIEVENPSNKKTIATVADGDELDIDLAVKSARFAFDNIWSKTKPNERQRLLLKLADLIETNAEKFALLESMDVGMPVMAAKMGLLPHIIAGLRYNAGWATKLNGETRETSLPGEWHTFTYREAIGVAGLITPWNVPLAIALNKMSAALAAGCTIVLKPAEQTPLSAIYLGQLITEAGFPDGVVNIVNGLGINAGAALVNHPLVDKISFTGSTLVGKNIIAQAANTLKRTSMELG
ncbi:MAG: aldehyde dehydrogenase family protein, partial [Caulobacterales bacterium]|nr:aldehyde dehydrogenase family protein [Caulobacterales bacterium]